MHYYVIVVYLIRYIEFNYLFILVYVMLLIGAGLEQLSLGRSLAVVHEDIHTLYIINEYQSFEQIPITHK